MPLPSEIIGINRETVTLVWEDGHETRYEARDLRLRCRCAMCIEEMTGAKLLDPSKVPSDVVARSIQLVGQYAILIAWSDGHSTGIYNFRELREDCPCEACRTRRANERKSGG